MSVLRSQLSRGLSVQQQLLGAQAENWWLCRPGDYLCPSAVGTVYMSEHSMAMHAGMLNLE